MILCIKTQCSYNTPVHHIITLSIFNDDNAPEVLISPCIRITKLMESLVSPQMHAQRRNYQGYYWILQRAQNLLAWL